MEDHPIRSVLAVIAIIAIIFFLCTGWYVVGPAERGVKVTLGHMDDGVETPGFGLKMPLLTAVKKVSVQQFAAEVPADCFSADLQQVKAQLRVLYRVSEGSVVTVLRDYAGDVTSQLIVPRVQEAIKEATALKTAADIVKSRESVKQSALANAREKIGAIVILDDLVIENLTLSADLERAIENKMVQQQESEKAVYRQTQAKTDAETAIIRARGEAEAMRVQGEALEHNPGLILYQMAQKWNGVAPQVLTTPGDAGKFLLPLPSPAPNR